MSKSLKKTLWAGFLLSLLGGILLTGLSYLVVRTTTGQYCSPNPSIDATVDCSLQVSNHGLPITYEVNPNYQPQHGLQPLAFIGDIAIWSVLSLGIILVIGKVRYA